MSPTAIGASVMLPAVLAALLLLAAWRPWRRPEGIPAPAAGTESAWALPIALAIGWLIALRVQEGEAIWELRQRWHWLVVAAAIGGGVPTLFALPWIRQWFIDWRRSERLGEAMSLNVAAIVGAFAIRWSLTLPGQESYAERLLLLVSVLIPAVLLWPATRREPGIASGAAMWASAAGLSAIVLMSGFAKLAISIGALASVAAAAGVLALWGGRRLGAPAGIAFASLLACATAAGRAYDDAGIHAAVWFLPLLSLLLLAAPLPRAWAERPLAAGLFRVVAVVTVVAIAVAAAAIQSGGGALAPSEGEGYESYYY